MKQRIITGVIIGLLVMAGIIGLPANLLALVVTCIGAIGFIEWANLMNYSGFMERFYIILSVLLLSLFLTIQIYYGLSNIFSIFYFLLPAVVFWLAMPYILIKQAKSSLLWLTNLVFLSLVSIMSTIVFFASVLILKEINVIILFYLIGLIVIADSGAYFIGKKFGKNKLAPNISPGKTIEGALGGLGLSMIYSLLFFVFYDQFSGKQIFFLLLLNILVVVVSISGDLFESVVKRHRGVKDSGSILPGHGGILDRIDAITAATPVFLFGYLLIV